MVHKKIIAFVLIGIFAVFLGWLIVTDFPFLAVFEIQEPLPEISHTNFKIEEKLVIQCPIGFTEFETIDLEPICVSDSDPSLFLGCGETFVNDEGFHFNASCFIITIDTGVIP